MVEQLANQPKDVGSNPTSPLHFCVRQIKKEETYQWLLKKHYARRVPSISFAYGLYNPTNELVGVLTYGMPPNYVEMKAWEPYPLLELNRLVVEDNLPKNCLSFFVAKTQRMLPPPVVIISYSDFRQGHQGYIYQATNWIYTGVGGDGQRIYVMKDGSERHQRHETDIDKSLVDHIETTVGKNRYYFFVGNKKEKEKMKSMLRFPSLPYPKGDNKRYDTTTTVEKQGILF